jgi:hypothetical protein
MTKHVVKVDLTQSKFRVNIPRKIIQRYLWSNVSHVLVEYCEPDQIVIRRLLNVEDLETKDNRNPVNFD